MFLFNNRQIIYVLKLIYNISIYIATDIIVIMKTDELQFYQTGDLNDFLGLRQAF